MCNENLVTQDTEIGKSMNHLITLYYILKLSSYFFFILLIISDPKDIFVIEEPFETYNNNSLQDVSLELETNVVHESRNYFDIVF